MISAPAPRSPRRARRPRCRPAERRPELRCRERAAAHNAQRTLLDLPALVEQRVTRGDHDDLGRRRRCDRLRQRKSGLRSVAVHRGDDDMPGLPGARKSARRPGPPTANPAAPERSGGSRSSVDRRCAFPDDMCSRQPVPPGLEASKSGDAPRAMARSRRVASSRGPRLPEARSALPIRPRRSRLAPNPAQNYRAPKRCATRNTRRPQASGRRRRGATEASAARLVVEARRVPLAAPLDGQRLLPDPQRRPREAHELRHCVRRRGGHVGAGRARVSRALSAAARPRHTLARLRGAAKLVLPPCRPDGRRAGSRLLNTLCPLPAPRADSLPHLPRK